MRRGLERTDGFEELTGGFSSVVLKLKPEDLGDADVTFDLASYRPKDRIDGFWGLVGALSIVVLKLNAFGWSDNVSPRLVLDLMGDLEGLVSALSTVVLRAGASDLAASRRRGLALIGALEGLASFDLVAIVLEFHRVGDIGTPGSLPGELF